MHEFERFPAPSHAEQVELVRRNPFAVVVGNAEVGSPVATHLPVIFPADAAPPQQWAGTTLLGHMARSNPQWQGFPERPELLLVFSGPHGYVSPTTYQATPGVLLVPTWNYAAVHLTGTVELIEDEPGTLAVVEQTVAAMESARRPGWDMSVSREVFGRLVPYVVAFRIRVTGAHRVFKLSQDMPADVRERVRDDVRRTAPDGDRLAELMTGAD